MYIYFKQFSNDFFVNANIIMKNAVKWILECSFALSVKRRINYSDIRAEEVENKFVEFS